MERCKYCKQQIKNQGYPHKIGHFCSEEHFDLYCETLSNEEYAMLMHSICPCSDDGDRE